MSFIDRVIDFLASEDVLDLYFILSDLVDVNITDAERCETAHYDAVASHTANENRGKDKNIPIGKRQY